MVDIDTARRFLAAEFESAGLPHAADRLAQLEAACALQADPFGWWMEGADGVGYFSRRMQPAALYAYRTMPGYSATALFARKGLEAA